MTTEADARLINAADHGNLQAVKDELANGADVNARAQFGDTALNLAAENGHLDVVEYLIACGADADPPHPYLCHPTC